MTQLQLLPKVLLKSKVPRVTVSNWRRQDLNTQSDSRVQAFPSILSPAVVEGVQLLYNNFWVIRTPGKDLLSSYDTFLLFLNFSQTGKNSKFYLVNNSNVCFQCSKQCYEWFLLQNYVLPICQNSKLPALQSTSPTCAFEHELWVIFSPIEQSDSG